MTSFELQAPAKLNLCLKVTGRREDGYHELQSLMVPLSVGDTLRVRAQQAAPLLISCNNPEIPTDADSLLGRAFRFAAERLDYAGGLDIELTKVTPIGAGLGGGSSDAAAVVQAVERITERELPADAYPELAYQVGADVPFFLYTRRTTATWMEGIGEVLKPCTIVPPLHFLLINPGIHISTQKVYQNLSRQLTSFEGPARVPPSFETLEQLLPFVTNDLESVVVGSHPIIAELKSQLTQHGAEAALMSGSGSTVFGLFSDNKTRKSAQKFFRNAYPDYWVCAAALLGR